MAARAHGASAILQVSWPLTIRQLPAVPPSHTNAPHTPHPPQNTDRDYAVASWRRLSVAAFSLSLLVGACTPQSSPSAGTSTPSVRTTSPTSPDPSGLPIPTDYRTVCDLEGSVFSCSGMYAEPTCDQSLPASVVRPLHLPTVVPGQPCPLTPSHAV